jgi:hypothetical protein
MEKEMTCDTKGTSKCINIINLNSVTLQDVLPLSFSGNNWQIAGFAVDLIIPLIWFVNTSNNSK